MSETLWAHCTLIFLSPLSFLKKKKKQKFCRAARLWFFNEKRASNVSSHQKQTNSFQCASGGGHLSSERMGRRLIERSKRTLFELLYQKPRLAENLRADGNYIQQIISDGDAKA